MNKKTTTTKRLTGKMAIDTAERLGLSLSHYTTPIEEAREGVSIEDARAIAREDPSLVYLNVDTATETVWILSTDDQILGTYRGDTARAAVEVWCREAGFASIEDCQAIAPRKFYAERMPAGQGFVRVAL